MSGRKNPPFFKQGIAQVSQKL